MTRRISGDYWVDGVHHHVEGVILDVGTIADLGVTPNRKADAPPAIPMVDCSWLDWHPGHGGTDEFLWGRDHALWRMQHDAYEDCLRTGRLVKPYTKPRPPIGGLVGLALRLLRRPR